MLTSDQRLAIQSGQHPDPYSVLGMQSHQGALCVNAFLPGAERVMLLDRVKDRPLGEMQRLAESDVFSIELPKGTARFHHRFLVTWKPHGEGLSGKPPVVTTIDDLFAFPLVLSDLDVWLLSEGSHLRPYECLGAHLRTIDGAAGVSFAVWAPSAKQVSVVGSFNQWDGRRTPMRLRRECGIWETFVPALAAGDLYKFEVHTQQGERLLKSDPYGFAAQMRPETASVVQALPAKKSMVPDRAKANAMDQPISVYEVHLGSWRKNDGWRWQSYRELAESLVPYAVDMGFTHIELLPISEHPFDGSWGYQPVGLFAPTSRFGSPADFEYFVKAAHDAGLGVILDWVPAHFPTDSHGLAQFDGTHLYEHADPREGFHQDWNTLIYNYGRREVQNFLVGNALYWLERYGIDGLRVDAVASMLYRDYSRSEGEWVPNQFGGRENLEAMAFLRRLNHVIGVERDGALMVAEESTSFPAVSRPPSDDLNSGGLGFHFKWNMGWMHDTLHYFARDAAYRRHHHNELTFGLVYAFSENFLLPFSHDEVVHGKGSLLARMPGDEWQKFANLRALFGFMWMYPGKKLVFMGCEWAQPGEWDADGSLPWELLDQPLHAGMQRLVRDLNRTYRHHKPLHQRDHSPDGFAWIAADDADQSVISWLRFDAQGHPMAVVCNLTPVPRDGYRIGVPLAGAWQEIFNTDASTYGGSGVHSQVGHTDDQPAHGQAQSLRLTLPPLACVVVGPI
jgi:1,4-alpha-glucan branching enzyme